MATTTDFTLPPVDSGRILESTQKASAFGRAAGAIGTIPGTGTLVHSYKPGKAQSVTEGGLKPHVPGTGSTLTITPDKLAVQDTISSELEDASEALANAIYDGITSSFGEVQDEIIRGAGNAHISGLGSATTVEVSNPADFYNAFAAVNAQGVEAEAIVLSSAQFYRLAGLTTALGLPVFTGLQSREGAQINGLPVYVYSSTVDEGFVGPFRSRAFYGTVEGYPRVQVFEDVLETADGIIALRSRNLLGILGETRWAFKVANVAEFLKTVAPAPAVEE